jgi:uncharacterized protein (DUF486 family)
MAFSEYCSQVPAHRMGSYEFSAIQLKTIQDGKTVTVFSGVSILYLDQPIRWNCIMGVSIDRGQRF